MNKQPFAILYLPEAKTGATQTVYGRSGKRYSFTPSELTNKRPARVYEDPEVFAREELDIRRNTRPTAVVCTSIGPVNPVIRTNAAIETLVASRQTLGAGAIMEALEAIVLKANAAIVDLQRTTAAVAGGASSESAPDIVPPFTFQSSPDGSVGVVAQGSAATEQPKTTEPAPATPAKSLPILNEAQAYVMPLPELKDLCRQRGVPASECRTRAGCVTGLMKAQQALATA